MVSPHLFLLLPSFRADIAAIHGRNGELHVSVGVGKVLVATLSFDDSGLW